MNHIFFLHISTALLVNFLFAHGYSQASEIEEYLKTDYVKEFNKLIAPFKSEMNFYKQ